MKQPEEQLHRGLEERHINLMALGATIGVGLFLGSAFRPPPASSTSSC
ncbi:hypothetical protein [Burkholderia sp. AU16741]|nr:hypothetical protein [Burkholderia sp. AU16741]